MKKFGPLVKTDAYRVSFIPVEGGETHCCVIEIRIKPGGRFEMYEDMNHEVSSLTRLNVALFQGYAAVQCSCPVLLFSVQCYIQV